MPVFCLGLNHKTAPVELRERLAFGTRDTREALDELPRRECLSEVVVLSTCNRVEIYGASESGDTEEALATVKAYLAERFELGHAVFEESFYECQRDDAKRHLLRVVSGLDSMMLGETEIFGQVKKAYASALDAGASAKILNKLFQHAFRVGKLVRSSTKITHGATSVGAAAVDLAGKIFGELSRCRVMIIGAGEMARRTAMSLKSRGAASIIVSNRSYDHAVDLAETMGGRAIHFDDWEGEIEGVDIMVTSTSAPHPVIHLENAKAAMRRRRGQPLFIIDIAVPRDVEPEVGEMDGVYLYDIDALEAVAADGRRQREERIAECDEIIDRELEKITALKLHSHAPGTSDGGSRSPVVES